MAARNSPTTTETMPASSEAKKPTENTEPKIARMRTAPTLMMMPSISAAPTRDHQPASA